MSLLDKKLKSVTQRRTKEQEHVSFANRTKRRPSSLLMGLILTILLLMGVILWLTLRKESHALQPKSVEAPVPKTQVTEKAPAPTPVIAPTKEKKAKALPHPKPKKPKAQKQPKRRTTMRKLPPKREKLDDLIKSLGEKPTPTTVSHSNKETIAQYHRALSHLENGYQEKAIHLLSSPEMEKATQGQSALTLARMFIKNKQLDRAHNLLKRIHPLYKPLEPKILLLLAHIYWQKKAYQSIVDMMLTESTPSIKDNTDYYAFLAQAYLKVNNPQLALTIYKKLLEINALNSQWWTGIGMTYQALKDPKNAVEAFEKVLKYEKKNSKLTTLARQKIETLRQEIESAKSDKKQPS